MKIVLTPFMYLAALGLVLSVIVHVLVSRLVSCFQ